MIGLEPSCVAMLRSDLLKLLPDDPAADVLARRVRTLAEVLREQAPDWQPPAVHRDVVQQVHCHPRAVLGHAADDALLRMAGVRVRRVSGCCGQAGRFSYQRGHEQLSAALAERALDPTVRVLTGWNNSAVRSGKRGASGRSTAERAVSGGGFRPVRAG